MTVKSSAEYKTLSRKSLARAKERLAAGDSIQAGENGWDAAAYGVKAIAQRRGWQYSSHRDLFRAAYKIASESGRDEITLHFSTAVILPPNTRDGWMPDNYLSRCLDMVEELLDILDEIEN